MGLPANSAQTGPKYRLFPNLVAALQKRFPVKEDGTTGHEFHDWMEVRGLTVAGLSKDMGVGEQLIQYGRVLGNRKIPGLLQMALDDYLKSGPVGR